MTAKKERPSAATGGRKNTGVTSKPDSSTSPVLVKSQPPALTPIRELLDALADQDRKPKRSGGGWSALCPAHADKRASLSVCEGDDGRVLLHCHAGCATDAVVSSLGLTMADLWPDSGRAEQRPDRSGRRPQRAATRPRPRKVFLTAGKAVAQAKSWRGPADRAWAYHNADGELVGLVLRWDREDGKDILPVSRNGDGWIIGGMAELRPLYRRCDIANHGRVYVHEGELAADAGRSVGLVSVTSAGGSKAPHKTNWTPLAGKDVVILPDNDDAGRAYARTVAGILTELPTPATVKIVELGGLDERGDFADWIGPDGPMSCKSPDEIRGGLLELAGSAPVWTPDPQDGCSVFLEYRPFPVDAMPEPVRGFVNVGAEALVCDPAFVALPMLAALASAIGNARRIELKSSWTEPAIVWTAIVAESGTMKSPAMELGLEPVRERQGAAMRQHDEAMKTYEAELMRYERDLMRWKREKGDGDPPQKPSAPVAERVWCDDTTVEALALLLRDQWRGLLMARDELSGWVGGFDRYAQGKGGDAAKWLEVHGGRSMMVDRKSSGTVYVNRAAVSITGTIQPGTLERVLNREHFDNGLAARLLLACPPRKAKRWTKATVDLAARAALAEIFERLYSLEPVLDEYGEPQPAIVKLTPEAEAAWGDFYNAHADEQVELTGDLAAAWSKLEGYAARLALVIHYVRWAASDATLQGPNALDAASIAAGVELSRWFGHEARRVYGVLGESNAERKERRLLELIRQKGGAISPRDLMRSGRTYTTAPEAEAALESLAREGLGHWEDVSPSGQGGRPSRRFVLADSADVDNTSRNQGNPSVASTSTASTGVKA